jgi:hypothetical protein
MVKKFKKTEKGWEEIEDKEDEEEKKESELEEELEDESIPDVIDTEQLSRFISGSGPPVLRKVAEAPQQAIRLERGVADAPTTGTENNGDDSAYLPKQAADEPKYIESDSHITHRTEWVDETQMGRRGEWERNRDQGSFFMQSESLMRNNNNSTNIEKYTAIERSDIDNLGRRDPFKREEKKYNPKLPKH